MPPVDNGTDAGETSDTDEQEDGNSVDVLRTDTEFTGSVGGLVFGTVLCLPFGIAYYYGQREQRIVCPECHGRVDMQANTCMHCNEDLTQYERR